jgi:hypothetical protein
MLSGFDIYALLSLKVEVMYLRYCLLCPPLATYKLSCLYTQLCRGLNIPNEVQDALRHFIQEHNCYIFGMLIDFIGLH